MYAGLVRFRLRNSAFLRGTNRLHHCMIYVPNKAPGSNKSWNYNNTSKEVHEDDLSISP